jgi:peroxiredoxin Q/BCP
MLSIGDLAPDFTAPTDQGSLTLSALRGQPVVLYFYPKDSTPGCTMEAKGFRDLHADFQAKGVHILGVSKDTAKKHQSFKAKECLPFTLVSDTVNICESYGAWREKSMYGRNYMGIARITFLIAADGTIAKIWDPVKAASHAAEVLASLP